MTDPVASPESRRERPAKPALTREKIVATAVDLFRSGGLSKVTMRSVARELDTGHASLYVYVTSTEDLHAQLLDAELGALALPDGSKPWRTSIVQLLVDYGTVLLSHPELARMAIRTRPNGPHTLLVVEALLAQLARGGITGRSAAWGVDVLVQYPTAVAAEHGGSAEKTEAVEPGRPDRDPDRFPLSAALADEMHSGTPRERAEWTINVLLDGLIAAVSATTAKAGN